MAHEAPIRLLEVRSNEVSTILQVGSVGHCIPEDAHIRPEYWNARQTGRLPASRNIHRRNEGISTRHLQESDGLASGTHLARTEKGPFEVLQRLAAQAIV